MSSILDRLLNLFVTELSGTQAQIQALTDTQNDLQRKVARLMVDQAQVDQQYDRLNTALTGISQDIQDLRNQIRPGAVISDDNFAKLSALADKFAALDAENPAADLAASAGGGTSDTGTASTGVQPGAAVTDATPGAPPSTPSA